MAETASQTLEEETASVSSVIEKNRVETTAGTCDESNEINSRSEAIIEPASLNETCKHMFTKISEYLQCELNGKLYIKLYSINVIVHQ